MPFLPSMVHSSNPSRYGTLQFGGLDHNKASTDGTIWSMKNFCSDYYPALGVRKRRIYSNTIQNPNGFYCSDGLFWVSGTGFYNNGVQKFTVANSAKKFASLGAYIIILPDKMYYNKTDGTYGNIESSVSNQAVTIKDGTYVEEEAEANTIYSETLNWSDYFKVGDAVTISGCTVHTSNNQTIIVREIDGHNLRFYENSFEIGSGGDTESSVSIARTMPDLDFICEHNNRLWGCKGDTIYSSKLGDIFNWNVFDGLSTDSYSVDVGSAGDFTACCSYLGYPCFFKEEIIYKVYGDKPSAYEVMSSANLGVETGSWNSFGIAGETLFYLSRAGVVSYTGGIPSIISQAFGEERYKNAVGGSDGVKYYVSMQDMSGTWHLFVYDTQRGSWHEEDNTHVLGFGWYNELYYLDSDGKVVINGKARSENIPQGATKEPYVDFEIEFNDFTESTISRKGSGKILIKMKSDPGTNVDIYIQYDSSGEWEKVSSITFPAKRTLELPLIPRRNDHLRLKLSGRGNLLITAIARDGYIGSDRF